jgi:hypothetical protein
MNMTTVSSINMDIPNISHYSTLLSVPISKAFQYYSDLESYRIRYPNYCMNVEKIGDYTENTVKTRELWNVYLGDDVEHIVVYLKYTLSQPTKILYEITDSSYKSLIGIKSGILLDERENKQTALEYNNVLLDAMSFPPHSKESDTYSELIDYFTVKDCIHLENKQLEPFKEGQLCTKCFRGRLQLPRTEEIYQDRRIKKKLIFWECNRCDFRWRQTILQA